MSFQTSTISKRVDFSKIRYAQCWEDTDVVLDALDIKPGDLCLSIASAGDNSLSMLAKNPGRVIAIDLSASQLALCDLKVQAIKSLSYTQVKELLGYQPSKERLNLFKMVEPDLRWQTREFFNKNKNLIELGLCSQGKFERYFTIFRKYLLPLVHSKVTIDELLEPKSFAERKNFYNHRWMSPKFRLLLKLFFSNQVMGMLGRDPQFFKYVDRSLPTFLEESIYSALVVKDPSQNPYLHWILTGSYDLCLPFWLVEGNYQLIKTNIEQIEFRESSLEEYLSLCEDNSFDCMNLSDIFEYISKANYRDLLSSIDQKSKPGARLAYWNMLVPRSVDAHWNLHIESRTEQSQILFERNKTFFYTRFNLEVKGLC